MKIVYFQHASWCVTYVSKLSWEVTLLHALWAIEGEAIPHPKTSLACVRRVTPLKRMSCSIKSWGFGLKLWLQVLTRYNGVRRHLRMSALKQCHNCQVSAIGC